jgi:hypothetical protein
MTETNTSPNIRYNISEEKHIDLLDPTFRRVRNVELNVPEINRIYLFVMNEYSPFVIDKTILRIVDGFIEEIMRNSGTSEYTNNEFIIAVSTFMKQWIIRIVTLQLYLFSEYFSTNRRDLRYLIQDGYGMIRKLLIAYLESVVYPERDYSITIDQMEQLKVKTMDICQITQTEELIYIANYIYENFFDQLHVVLQSRLRNIPRGPRGR